MNWFLNKMENLRERNELAFVFVSGGLAVLGGLLAIFLVLVLPCMIFGPGWLLVVLVIFFLALTALGIGFAINDHLDRRNRW